MSTHDPQKVVEDLRNHLAVHDRPPTFLFGAGTSSAINIAPEAKPGEQHGYIPLVPAIAALTEQCKTTVCGHGEAFEKAWQLIESHCKEDNQVINIENILSKVRSKIDAIGSKETLVGLSKDDLLTFEEIIRETIATAASPSEENIPEDIPHHHFASWVKEATRVAPIEIFTTNYDILLERSLELSATPLFDGFVGAHNPFFLPDSLDREDLLPPADWVRLWKIHGSINWQLADSFQPVRIIRTQPKLTGEMILPSHRKYDESRKQPYTALLDRLGRVLNREHSLLITCGFSFSDEHINSLIFSVLDNQPTANVISLQHGELSQDTPIVKWALSRTNLKVIGPNAGVISGRWGTWHLLNPVDNSTSAFMDLAFDSNAWEETEGGEVDLNAGVRIGQMRLGDFNWFCQFLNTMRSRTEEKQ